jgi:hypothetical protein
MDRKNIIIMAMGYIGILIIVLGFILSPSPGDLKDAEIRMEYFTREGYLRYEEEVDYYELARLDYDRIKRQEVIASHLVPIGLALVFLTIPFAILRYTRQDFRPPQPPYEIPNQRVQKPENFLINKSTAYQERP